MAKRQLNFFANGRMLFESEKAAVDVFTSKYAPEAPRVSERDAQDRMSKVQVDVRRAVSNGQTFATAFYADVQQARRAASPSATAKKAVVKKSSSNSVKVMSRAKAA